MAHSEFDLIYRYLASFGTGPNTVLGVGDDAAVMSVPAGHELLVSSDTQVEGVHFFPDTLPENLAYRVVSAAASDLAAMGATPLGMTLSLTLPEADELWLHSFSMGLGAVVSDLSLPLVGGDVTRGSLTLGVTVLGHSPVGAWVPRTGAQVGDWLCVSGSIGDAACALALMSGELTDLDCLDPDDEQYLEQRFYRPTPRLALADWLRQTATACIDVSDGLLADCGHIGRASGVGCRIDATKVPLSASLSKLPGEQALRWALTGGDDYELVMTVPEGTPLPDGITQIGQVTDDDGVTCTGYSGDDLVSKDQGYDHFRG